jgi:hypothetical protein
MLQNEVPNLNHGESLINRQLAVASVLDELMLRGRRSDEGGLRFIRWYPTNV